MKELLNGQVKFIAGGTQSFIVTSKITYDGISDACIQKFYEQHKGSPGCFTSDDFLSNLHKICDGLPSEIGLEQAVISLKLVDE